MRRGGVEWGGVEWGGGGGGGVQRERRAVGRQAQQDGGAPRNSAAATTARYTHAGEATRQTPGQRRRRAAAPRHAAPASSPAASPASAARHVPRLRARNQPARRPASGPQRCTIRWAALRHQRAATPPPESHRRAAAQLISERGRHTRMRRAPQRRCRGYRGRPRLPRQRSPPLGLTNTANARRRPRGGPHSGSALPANPGSLPLRARARPRPRHLLLRTRFWSTMSMTVASLPASGPKEMSTTRPSST